MSRETRHYALGGGLDLTTPPILTKPGRALAGLNYEPILRGYRRIEGYQRLGPGPVPGTGPVRGVWMVKGAVMAFRDAADRQSRRLWTLNGEEWSERASLPRPGGRLRFCAHNFYGSEDRRRVYLCDGENPAQAWDGDTLKSIATGMGKDTPGSPLTDSAVFPREGVVWELNYRGELDFMGQALVQRAERSLTVADGWEYFVHGWSQVISHVLHVQLGAPMFERLSKLAAAVR